VIPRVEFTPTVPATAPTCILPPSEEISEEGFGYFRGTWFIGRVTVAEAEEVIRAEAEILDWLDDTATTPEQFEVLARAIETQETTDVAHDLGTNSLPPGLERFATEGGDVFPLYGLEVGVAGLCHALSVVGCLTAASCRSHATERTWSDAPVVFFRGPTWRVELLMEPIAAEQCGLGESRGMLTINAASVVEMHSLAERLLNDRARFRRIPDHHRPARRSSFTKAEQLSFQVDSLCSGEY
jgi:hypothetical protein